MDATNIDKLSAAAKEGKLPEQVQMFYWTEGKRQIVAAVRLLPEHSAFQIGWSVFRRDYPTERFYKKDLRETAVKRLLKKPVFIAGPPIIPVIRRGETQEDFEDRRAKTLHDRTEEFLSVFSKRAVEMYDEHLPSPVYRRNNESYKKYLERKKHSTSIFLGKHPTIQADQVDGLRRKKVEMGKMRRKFFRQAISTGYKVFEEQQDFHLQQQAPPPPLVNAATGQIVPEPEGGVFGLMAVHSLFGQNPLRVPRQHGIRQPKQQGHLPPAHKHFL